MARKKGDWDASDRAAAVFKRGRETKRERDKKGEANCDRQRLLAKSVTLDAWKAMLRYALVTSFVNI